MRKLEGCAAVLAGLLVGLAGASSQAAVITTINASNDASISDNNHDNTGDSINANTGYILFATSNQNATIDYVFAFSPTSIQRAALLGASPGDINLNIDLSSPSGTPATTASLVGLTNQISSTVVPGDLQAAATTLAPAAWTPTSPVGVSTFDVTSFVQSQLLADPSNILKFRIQLDGAWSTPSPYWRYGFSTVASANPETLTVVPEPLVGLAGIAFLGALAVGRRKRSGAIGK